MPAVPRRTVALAIAASLVGARAMAQAVPNVGVIYLGDEEAFRLRLEALRSGLRQNGLVEDKSIRLIVRYANGEASALGRLAGELEAAGCVLIITSGTTSVRAVRNALPNMPIVMAASADPVGSGFANSLARPGRNITGVSIFGTELGAKRFQLLKEIVPRSRTLVLLMHADNPANETARRNYAAVAETLGIDIQSRAVRTVEEIGEAFAWAARLPAGGAYVLSDPVFTQNREALFRLAMNQRLPTISPEVTNTHAGALVAYGPDAYELRRQAGPFVAAILRGVPAGDLPIEQPAKLLLSINLRTARTLGVDIPPSILARADEVIDS